jgi:hypothetical protein
LGRTTGGATHALTGRTALMQQTFDLILVDFRPGFGLDRQIERA